MVRIDRPEQLAKGLRVKLTHPAPWYDIMPSNPVIGSKYECEGTITGFRTNPNDYDDDACHIHVIWDNGNNNSYHFGTLSIISAGRCISIWED